MTREEIQAIRQRVRAESQALEEIARKRMVGMHQGEASILLQQHGYVLRVIKIGDEHLPLTGEHDERRMNAMVDKEGIITKMDGVY